MDYSNMLLPELKAEAKRRPIKGFSTMKKAELIDALELNDAMMKAASAKFEETLESALDNSAKGNVESLGDFTEHVTTVDYLALAAKSKSKSPSRVPSVESTVEAIKAAIRNAKDARKMAGVEASRSANVTSKQTLARKLEVYTDHRNGGQMSARQRRRYKKAYNQGALPS